MVNENAQENRSNPKRPGARDKHPKYIEIDDTHPELEKRDVEKVDQTVSAIDQKRPKETILSEADQQPTATTQNSSA